MSLLKSIAKIGKKALKTVAGSTVGKLAASVIPGVGPIAATAIGAIAGGIGGGGGGPRIPTPLPGGAGGLPSIVGLSTTGRQVLAAAGASAAANWLYDAMGNPVRKKHRRRKGISAKDLTSFKRVARLVDRYSKPVGKMRNYKPKKEF